MMTKSERHKKLCDILNELYQQKNAAYGDSFHKTFLEEGYAMARIRLSDKLNRFKALSRNPNLDSADESMQDTLLDLANYALMTVLEIRETDGADEPDVHAELFRAMNDNSMYNEPIAKHTDSIRTHAQKGN